MNIRRFGLSRNLNVPVENWFKIVKYLMLKMEIKQPVQRLVHELENLVIPNIKDTKNVSNNKKRKLDQEKDKEDSLESQKARTEKIKTEKK